MRGFVPPRPSGFSAEALFYQAVWDRLFGREGQYCDSATIKWKRTSHGVIADALVAGGGGRGGETRQARLLEVHDFYLLCEWWDGSAAGAEVRIAKPWALRFFQSQSPLGVVHGYTYEAGPDSLNLYRNDDDGATVEQQLVTPVWILHDMIYAVKVDFIAPIYEDGALSGGVWELGAAIEGGLEWLMLDDGRAWSAVCPGA